MSEIRFGTAGVGEDFARLGYKKTLQVPDWLAGHGLNAFEYQCGRGVRLSEENGKKLQQAGQKKNIRFSLHAPYYISMSSLEEDKRLNSINYLLQSAAAVKSLGGSRVIFHSGSCGKQSRQQALEKALDTMRRAVCALDEAGFSDVTLCPEVMGKVNQLGTVEEVLALCKVDPRITPCVDFGHLNARTQGGLSQKQDFARVLDQMADALADERASRFHVHFSKIEYTAGGEKRHLTFADQAFGPDFEPLLELCWERGLSPTIICESAGTQAEDAAAMMAFWNMLVK
ncbi:MAG: TIM barrel protein [Pygmaiobacter massiliensis]|nr:TIM barrel protein [Pygmaiobacter massiliensis]